MKQDTLQALLELYSKRETAYRSQEQIQTMIMHYSDGARIAIDRHISGKGTREQKDINCLELACVALAAIEKPLYEDRRQS